MTTRIQVGNASRSLPLTLQGLMNVKSDKLVMTDASGKYMLSVPSADFPLRAEPGEILYATITLLHVVTSEEPDTSPILIEKAN